VQFPAFATDDLNDSRFSLDFDAMDSDATGDGIDLIGFAFSHGATIDHRQFMIGSAADAV
jgi:hypothetical protein